MKLKRKIVSKKPHPSGFEGYIIKTSDGKEWSIRNFGGKKWLDTYKVYPSKVRKMMLKSVYKRWEAWDGKVAIRAKTLKELRNKIETYD